MDEELKCLLTGTILPNNSPLPVGKNKSERFIPCVVASIVASDLNINYAGNYGDQGYNIRGSLSLGWCY